MTLSWRLRPPLLREAGKVARRAGWGVVHFVKLGSDCTSITPDRHRTIPAFHTPSGASRHLPRQSRGRIEHDQFPLLDGPEQSGRPHARELRRDALCVGAARPPAAGAHRGGGAVVRVDDAARAHGASFGDRLRLGRAHHSPRRPLAGGALLAYFGECNVAANREDGMAPAGAATIRALARGDDRAREQYLDIFSGRAFREAVITHATRAAGVSREIRRDRLDAFHFVAPRALKAIPPSAAGENWRIASGDDAIEIDEQAVAGAIKRLIARLPRSSRLEDIAPAAATEPYLRERVGDALASLVAFGLCGLSTEPVVCASRLAERPRAWRIAASDARVGAETSSLRHAQVRLEPLQRLYLPLLDGTRTRDDLLAHALDLAERGEMQVSGPDGSIEGRDNLLARLAPATDRCLESLLRLGLLEGE